MSAPEPVSPHPHTHAPADEQPPQAPQPPASAKELPSLAELTIRAAELAADIMEHETLLHTRRPDRPTSG